MPAFRAYHSPKAWPHCSCGVDALDHCVEHAYVGNDDVCEECTLPYRNHRRRYRPGRFRRPDAECVTYIGIDGEGQGRRDHRYVMLAASDKSGAKEYWISANPGIGRLTTEECLQFILGLPTKRTKIFSFSFNYDLTKILTDLPNQTLYELFRPKLPCRKRRPEESFKGPIPVEWCGPSGKVYQLNLQGTKFVVQLDKKRVVIWDLFKFFQSKFVAAIKDWKVGNAALWDRMELMKNKRDEFDKLQHDDILKYCFEECRCMAELAEKLIDSHRQAGLLLKSYFGAGSSGAAMLTAMGVTPERIRRPLENMRLPVAMAFFGGRFENSVIGPIRERLHIWDISSAYVYRLAFLPCLEHGSWTHTKRRKDLERAEAQSGALVRYSLGPNPGIEAWGPFPFRERNGSISFPIESGGGWVWLDEYLVGERMFPHVQFHEAFVYSSNCNCKPFGQIPKFYNHRLKIGKEGPGLVVKLGMNSCYGKLAQSIGNAVFNSWIWAGMITSGTRAQLLEMLALHKNPANVLMMATDGLLTHEHIKPPIPLPTGTGEPYWNADKRQHESKPLGGWEHKDAKKGMFLARPGIYFPLEPTEDEINAVRARGVGRSVVVKSWQVIMDAWHKDGIKAYAHVTNVTRFCGAKTSISVNRKGQYKRAAGKNGKPAYGQWIAREVALSFDPKPKREGLHKDGVRLKLRKYPFDETSYPYSKALSLNNPEAQELIAAKQELLEQPDADLTEYEPEMT